MEETEQQRNDRLAQPLPPVVITATPDKPTYGYALAALALVVLLLSANGE